MRIIIIFIDDTSLALDNTAMRIDSLQCGDQAEVLGYTKDNPAYRHRLLAMGLIPGTRFQLLRIAPLGDPVEIQVRGYALSLRKAEAAIIQIKRVEQ